ncbi:unnamed protein product [Rotaria socialis]|uniref:Pentapeptide repeat-containing protein n=1 Tax=Rotaria socialis TaxID=392032 RepID=A0A819BGT0_9BILA|nr:unnamed protein product [Rotaria socialis]CAF4890290.1 unnamed protein product [Rotaria socialis]
MIETPSNSHSWFEWIQLIATICVPVAIGIFTIIQNQSQSEQQRNNLKIAAENRLKDIEIADYNREKDRWLADDQQKENILVDYQNFLANLLEKHGMTLNGTSTVRFVARFRTLIALNQLNSARRSFLIRSLYEAQLISFRTIQTNNTMTEFESVDTPRSIVDLSSANLSGLSLGINEDDNDECPRECIPGVRIDALVLSQTQLKNAFFRKLYFQGALFVKSIMDSVDFRCAYLNGTNDYLTFANSLLIHAKFHKACAQDVSFQSVDLYKAQMHGMVCRHCIFRCAQINHADLHDVFFYREDVNKDKLHDEYENINFTETSLIGATFDHLSLRGTLFIGTNLSRIRIINCVFSRDSVQYAAATFEKSTLINATIENSSFDYVHFIDSNLSGAKIFMSNFTHASMKNIDLTGATLEMCNFSSTNLAGCIMTNANIHLSYFVDSDLTGCQGITDVQLAQAKSIAGAILPNGSKISSI